MHERMHERMHEHTHTQMVTCMGTVLVCNFSMCTDNAKFILVRTVCLWWNYTNATRQLHVAYSIVFRIMLQLARDCRASNMFIQMRIPKLIIKLSSLFSHINLY